MEVRIHPESEYRNGIHILGNLGVKSRDMGLPLVSCVGDPYHQGLAQGEALRGQIAHNLETYFRRFRVEGGLSEPQVMERAESYCCKLAHHYPDYYHGMQGIADGGGFDLVAVVALNVRYEILYHQFADPTRKPALVDGCTAFALHPSRSADGSFYLGQNWDWIADVQGALLHSETPDGHRVLAFTEAGIFGGKIGLNSAGLALCINGLVSAADNWAQLGKPFHVRTHEALLARTLEEATQRILAWPRSGSANYLLGQGDRAVNIEISPTGQAYFQDEVMVHANHFLANANSGIEPTATEWLDRSEQRQQRLDSLLHSRHEHTLDDLQSYLADSDGAPLAICRHPSAQELQDGDPYQTVASIILSPDQRALWVSDGPPDQNAYRRYQV